METPVQQCHRLLSALEELASQEAAMICAEDYAGIGRGQKRAAPLVARLVSLALESDLPVRQRVLALVARRNANQEKIDAHVARTQAELQRTQLARGRVFQMAPAYRGARRSGARRLVAQA